MFNSVFLFIMLLAFKHTHLISDFAVFVKQKGITHVTSSPHYAQSNGKSENAVKTLKLLFAKAKQSGESEYMALLEWRNTPSEGISTSPAQRIMGRR